MDMSETAYGDEYESQLPVLPVSDRAIHGLSLDVATLQHLSPQKRQRYLSMEMGRQNLRLPDVSNELLLHWSLQGNAADYFEEGFALGHRLLFYEAQLTRDLPTTLEPETIDGFMVNIQPSWHWSSIEEYHQERLDDLGQNNPDYIRGLFAIMPTDRDLTPEHITAFMVGAFNVYDVLLQQRRADDMMEEYRQGAIESTHVLPADFLR